MVFIHIEGQGHDYNDRTLNETREAWDFMKRFTLASTTGIGGEVSVQTAAPRITAGYAAGALRLRGGAGILGAQVRDARGKLLHAWESGADPALEVDIPADLARGGIYLVAVQTATGHSVLRLALP